MYLRPTYVISPERAAALSEVRQFYVADREAGILALLVKARDLNYAADYLIRGSVAISINDNPGHA